MSFRVIPITLKQETTIKYIDCKSRSNPISKYKCLSCKAEFLDVDDNYVYCPYCGAKIVEHITIDKD